MAQSLPAALKLGLGPLFGSRRELASTGAVFQPGTGVEHLQHLLRVGLPVRRKVQNATGTQPRCEQLDKRGLYKASLVMTLLVPGVSELLPSGPAVAGAAAPSTGAAAVEDGVDLSSSSSAW